MRSLLRVVASFFLPMLKEQTLQKVTTVLYMFFVCLSDLNSSHLVLLRDFQLSFPFAVTALRSVRRSLIDPKDYLRNWNRGDPCRSNWTGVICFNEIGTDDYLHVRELYDLLILFFLFFPLCVFLLSLLVCLYICWSLTDLNFWEKLLLLSFFSFFSRNSCLNEQLFLY